MDVQSHPVAFWSEIVGRYENILTDYFEQFVTDQCMFFIYPWARSQQVREDITDVNSSLIGLELAHWQTDRKWYQGPVSIRKTVLPGMAIPMLKIRRPIGRLIFNMGIAIRR